MEEFVNEINNYCEPIKDEIQNIDRFSMLLLLIGFFGTGIMALIFGYFVGVYISAILAFVFMTILACTFYRNNREMQAL